MSYYFFGLKAQIISIQNNTLGCCIRIIFGLKAQIISTQGSALGFASR
jgi:hypothetical protein